MTKLAFRTISHQQTYPLRHKVMWPNKPQSHVVLDDDATGKHFGAFKNNELVAVASIFINKRAARLRKLAVDHSQQSQGIGSQLLIHIIETLKKGNELDELWCDARETAMPFYERLGFDLDEARFYKSDVAYRKARIKL